MAKSMSGSKPPAGPNRGTNGPNKVTPPKSMGSPGGGTNSTPGKSSFSGFKAQGTKGTGNGPGKGATVPKGKFNK